MSKGEATQCIRMKWNTKSQPDSVYDWRTEPIISIIIITRNRPFLLRHCLEHVLTQPYPHKELIVVDSSSNDESEQVVAQYPEVISVRLYGQHNNRPQAKNEGMAISSGDMIAFIDDDSMVEPGWLDALIDTYRDETVGGVGGRIIAVPKPHCELFADVLLAYIRPPGQCIAKNVGLVTDQFEVDWLSGGNMSFRREVLEQVGGFDPAYTLTNLREETDLGFRVKRAGWRLVLNPAMAVVHFSPRSSSRRHFEDQPLTRFSAGRNSAYFTVKHFGLNPYTLAWQLILAPAKTYGQVVLQTVIHSIAAVAQNVGRLFGLVAGICWLASSRRQARSAPKVLQPNSPIAACDNCTVLNKREMF